MRLRPFVGVALLGFALALTSCVPPVVLTGPSLQGTAEIGETLTVRGGEWLLAGSFSFVWQRCEADGADCATIGAATVGSYTVAALDADKRLRARVTNTNAFGSQVAYTPPSQVVPGPDAAKTRRASVASDGTQGNRDAFNTSLSADARFVTFWSPASNLVAGDTNGHADAFVHDRQTAITTRVSVSTGGAQGNDFALHPVISADGRYVAFESYASNLVAADTNGDSDVFVHDRQTGATQRVSVATGGLQSDGGGSVPSISADGRYVAFWTSSSNVVAGDTNAAADVFVHDRQAGTTQRVSVATGGSQGNGGSGSSTESISADGRYVAFTSSASNLVAGDTNAGGDVFLHDRQAGSTVRVSLKSGGAQAEGGSGQSSVSADGRYVAFNSWASDLVGGDTNAQPDVFVHDRLTASTTRVSVATGGAQASHAYGVSLSADGRRVAFYTSAPELVPGDTNLYSDAFVHDRLTATTTRVSVATGGAQANSESDEASLSADGSHVVFGSRASNLVPRDTNSLYDVFVRELG